MSIFEARKICICYCIFRSYAKMNVTNSFVYGCWKAQFKCFLKFFLVFCTTFSLIHENCRVIIIVDAGSENQLGFNHTLLRMLHIAYETWTYGIWISQNFMKIGVPSLHNLLTSEIKTQKFSHTQIFSTSHANIFITSNI